MEGEPADDAREPGGRARSERSRRDSDEDDSEASSSDDRDSEASDRDDRDGDDDQAGSGGAGARDPNEPPAPAAPVAETGGEGDVVINEVSCRGDEYVELVNRGGDPIELSDYALGDSDRAGSALSLNGVLDAGARAVFDMPGLACEDDAAVLFRAGEIVHRVRAPLMPANASYARIPDTRGAFSVAANTPGEENAELVDAAARLFLDLDAPVPDPLPQLRIGLGAAAEAGLRAAPDTWVEGTVSFRDERGVVDPVSTGVRLKGQSIRRTLDEKAAFKLDFDRFSPGSHLFGIEKLTLNNMMQDPSASHERLFYGLGARQGLAVPRVGYVEVFVNDVSFGVYLVLESSDEEGYLGRSFPSTALLYEGEYGQDLYSSHVDAFDEDYGEDPSRAVLQRIIAEFEATSGPGVLASTRDTIDWERVVPQMAADIFCGHFDSYTVNRNNFTLHVDDAGRLSLISGGPDQSFTQVVDIADTQGQGLLLVRCLEDSDCAALLDQALSSMSADVGAWLRADAAARLRADAATLEAHFDGDSRREWDSRQLPGLVEEAIDFIEGRVAAFR
jgi:hypothetical protein